MKHKNTHTIFSIVKKNQSYYFQKCKKLQLSNKTLQEQLNYIELSFKEYKLQHNYTNEQVENQLLDKTLIQSQQELPPLTIITKSSNNTTSGNNTTDGM